MTRTALTLEFVGYHHEWSGDLFYMSHEDGREATVFVDSVGQTWVDVRRIPEGGWFPSERVEAWRAFNGAARAAEKLAEQGFANKRVAQFAHRVTEREDG